MTYREVLRVLIIKNLSEKEIKYLNQRLINMYKNENGVFLGREKEPAGWKSRYTELEKKVHNTPESRYRKTNPFIWYCSDNYSHDLIEAYQEHGSLINIRENYMKRTN